MTRPDAPETTASELDSVDLESVDPESVDLEYSVVVPTFERLDTLPEVLDALVAQEGAPSFEVIVIDDGSSDATWEWLGERSERAAAGEFTGPGGAAPPLRIARQDNAGPATARNRGVDLARGRRVAFLGDDTAPRPDWLAWHERAVVAHSRSSEAGGRDALAVIGYTRWHPRMRTNAFLRYINEWGLQFGYALIEDPANVPFNFFYTSNLSLPRQCLVDEPFDTGFPYAAWEDTELSYRLHAKGLRLVYEPRAVTWHDHPTSLARFTARQEKAGYCAVVFHQRHPELGPFLGLGPEGPPPVPPAGRQRLRHGLARLLQNLFSWWKTPKLWEDVLRYHYIQGLHRGWRDLEPAGDFESKEIES